MRLLKVKKKKKKKMRNPLFILLLSTELLSLYFRKKPTSAEKTLHEKE